METSVSPTKYSIEEDCISEKEKSIKFKKLLYIKMEETDLTSNSDEVLAMKLLTSKTEENGTAKLEITDHIKTEHTDVCSLTQETNSLKKEVHGCLKPYEKEQSKSTNKSEPSKISDDRMTEKAEISEMRNASSKLFTESTPVEVHQVLLSSYLETEDRQFVELEKENDDAEVSKEQTIPPNISKNIPNSGSPAELNETKILSSPKELPAEIASGAQLSSKLKKSVSKENTSSSSKKVEAIEKTSVVDGSSSILLPQSHMSKRIAAAVLKRVVKKMGSAIIIKRLSNLKTVIFPSIANSQSRSSYNKDALPSVVNKKDTTSEVLNYKKDFLKLPTSLRKQLGNMLKDGMEYDAAIKIVLLQKDKIQIHKQTLPISHNKFDKQLNQSKGHFSHNQQHNNFPRPSYFEQGAARPPFTYQGASRPTFPKQGVPQPPFPHQSASFNNAIADQFLPNPQQSFHQFSDAGSNNIGPIPGYYNNFNPLNHFPNFQWHCNQSLPNFESTLIFNEAQHKSEGKKNNFGMMQSHGYQDTNTSISNSSSNMTKKNSSSYTYSTKISLGHADAGECLNDKQLTALQQAILKALQEIPDIGPEVKFRGCSQENGWLIINCVDQASAQWVEYVSKIIQPWPGARIRFFHGSPDLSNVFVVRVLIPDDNEYNRLTADDVLIRLRKMNRQLNTNNWKVLNREIFGSSQYWTFKIDNESKIVLEEMDSKAYFGFGQVEFFFENLKHSKSKTTNLQHSRHHFLDQVQSSKESYDNNWQSYPAGKNNSSKSYMHEVFSENAHMNSNKQKEANRFKPYKKPLDNYHHLPEKTYPNSPKKFSHGSEKIFDKRSNYLQVKPPKPPKAPRISRSPGQSFSGESLSGDPSDLDFPRYDKKANIMKSFQPYYRR